MLNQQPAHYLELTFEDMQTQRGNVGQLHVPGAYIVLDGCVLNTE